MILIACYMAAIAATSNYYQDNKDELRERTYKWRREHPERHRAAKSEAYKRKRIYYIEQDKARYSRIRAELFAILGKQCIRCGFADIRALQVDHVEGGGNAEHRHLKSARTMYQFCIDNPDLARKRLQILCANCNWIKKAERNEAPIKEIIQKLQSHVNALQNSYAATAHAKSKVLPILASTPALDSI